MSTFATSWLNGRQKLNRYSPLSGRSGSGLPAKGLFDDLFGDLSFAGDLIRSKPGARSGDRHQNFFGESPMIYRTDFTFYFALNRAIVLRCLIITR